MKDYYLNIKDFEYDLPAGRIAMQPVVPRDSSKLLIWKDGKFAEDRFANIDHYLEDYSMLVRNNTRVIHARLVFYKDSGARIEIFCLEPLSPTSEVQQALQAGPGCLWKCMIGNAKKWKSGLLQMEVQEAGQLVILTAEKLSSADGDFLVKFSWDKPQFCLAEVLEAAGKVPLPPYIHREATDQDQITYQTIYANHDGSVAAPTAGLHFTEEVMQRLVQKSIGFADTTLHVGAGTFKPVTTENVSDHRMHSEQIHLKRGDLERIRTHAEHIIATGTTSLRSLESFYTIGAMLHAGYKLSFPFRLEQWDAYDEKLKPAITPAQAWNTLADYMDLHKMEEISGETALMIVPAYRIRTAKALITNFHQPGSTLLLLVASFIGDVWKEAYTLALQKDFRFLSYGDACLFYRRDL